MRSLIVAAAITLMGTSIAVGSSIRYEGRAPEGLAGNGKAVVKVRPDGFEFFSGGNAKGRFRLVHAGKRHAFSEGRILHSEFFPGGVIYSVRIADRTVDVLHGALPDVPYLLAFRITNGNKQDVEFDMEIEGSPDIQPSDQPWDDLRSQVEAPYQKGFRLRSPAPSIDRAIRFSQFLLDLGFDGRLHVSELFRWRDIWSRDLGSGLAPGALIGGRFDAARVSISYDLKRYAAAHPAGLRITEDASQGGSAEGTAWLARAVWRDYLLTGDRAFLAESAGILRPWVDAWIDRDADEDGLVVDVTEWMDHSRFFLFPDGSLVLYSNALFADLLGTFSKIEKEIKNEPADERLRELQQRSVEAINERFWNDSAGAYDNLILWDRRDERLSSAENALAVLAGVAPPDRARRALATVRERNWRKAGSVTIAPAMTHVDDRNDQNVRVWPWWNAVEARARFRTDDAAGGIHLLEKCAATLEDEHYPGLIEELLTPDGVTEGGHAFLSAAGTFLDAVWEGLLGIEILEGGCGRIRVSPSTPGWDSWEAVAPLPQGELSLAFNQGQLRIRVTDPRVKIVEAPDGSIVEGAEWAALPTDPSESDLPQSKIKNLKSKISSPSPRRAALFYEKNIPLTRHNGLPAKKISADQLAHLDPTTIGALVIAGNALPRRTREGIDVQEALALYLDKGGALVFFGATMHDRGTMGEHGGVIDWYEHLPLLRYESLSGWKFQISPDGPGTPLEQEQGFAKGWHKPGFDDAAWKPIRVPGWWEDHLGGPRDGWGWYRTAFQLPKSAAGKTVVLDLGRIDDDDWTYVNGVLAGSDKGWQTRRLYHLKPGAPAYAALKFGGSNVIAVQVLDGGGGGGMHADPTNLALETDEFAWQPINPKTGIVSVGPIRHGVVSWGPGGNFFNSWETSRGAFGFKVEGRGVTFNPEGPLGGLPVLEVDAREAFTDFACARPWRFEPLAFTETRRKLLHPDRGERYPCAARIVNTRTGGEFILIPASIAATSAGPGVLQKLNIDVSSKK